MEERSLKPSRSEPDATVLGAFVRVCHAVMIRSGGRCSLEVNELGANQKVDQIADAVDMGYFVSASMLP